MSRYSDSDSSAPLPLEESIVDDLSRIATSYLSDQFDRLSGVIGLRCYNARQRLVGSAFTVKTRPGDNLFIYKALNLIRPGHVLVVDAGGDLNNALVGELMALYAERQGCVGFVIDGAIRDVSHFEQNDFPCFARGNTHKGPYRSGPGLLNVSVSIGGQVVNPGDAIVGDEDGLMAFPSNQAGRLINLAQQKVRAERAIKDEIASENSGKEWLDGVLAGT